MLCFMNNFQLLYHALEKLGARQWAEILPIQLQQAFADEKHGDLSGWQNAIGEFPDLHAAAADLVNQVSIGAESEIDPALRELLEASLQKLHPWRKGPYCLFGIELDAEWRCDLKWDRLKRHIAPLKGRSVLDVGSGNGYYCWRMLGAGAGLVIGIDPMLLNVMQFQAIQKFYGDAAIYVLPLGIEDVPANMRVFDTVFSMGVLYHRRSPIDHLLELKGCLRPGGELILETLIVEGDAERVLVPQQRYAAMRNVWFIPSADALRLWMHRCGYKNVRLVNVTKTRPEEQRSTQWMRFHSLRDFLDPQDDNLTCEGLPAPVRALLIANVD